MTPKKGKRTAGSMAAMARGMASVIQKIAISSRTKEHSASCAHRHAQEVLLPQLHSPATARPLTDSSRRIGRFPLLSRAFIAMAMATNLCPDDQRKRKQQQRRRQDQDGPAKVPEGPAQRLHAGSALTDCWSRLKVHALQVTWSAAYIRIAALRNC